MMLSLIAVLLVILSISYASNDNDITTFTISLDNVLSSSLSYIVFYYMSNDEQSNNFYPLLSNMKEKVEAYGIKFGAIDCYTNKKECKSVNLMTMPSIQLYIDDPVLNPYTKKNYRNGIFFDTRSGPADLKELERFINKNYPNKIVTNVDNLDSYANPKIPPAVFFTEKKVSSSMLLKSIAHEFRDAITVIQFDASKNSEAIKSKHNISKFPALMVIDTNNDNHYYDGDLRSRQDIIDWLKQFATSTSKKSSDDNTTKNNDSKKANSNDDSDLIKTFTSSSFVSLSALSTDDAWIVAVTKSGASKEIDNWNKNVQACEGHIRAAEITCLDTTNSDTLGEKLCMGKLPFIVQVPHGANNRKKLDESEPLKWKRYIYESNEIEEARKEAGESLPESAVMEISEQIFEGVVNTGHNNNQITVVIISEKSNATPMLRNLALSLKNVAQVGLMANPSAQFMAQIGNPKLPTAIFGTYISQVNEKTKAPEMKIQLMAWDHKVYGPLRFSSIYGMTYSFYKQSGLANEKADTIETQSVGDRQKELITLETEEDWNSQCGDNYRGICAIGFIPSGSEGDNAKQILTQVLETLSVVSALKFLVIDAGCQREFAETFFIQGSDVPTITAYSPSKSRYVNFRGSFSLSSAREFLESVLHGKKSTIPISTRPTVATTCDTSNDEPIIEDTDDANDFLAEIRKEEEEKKRQLKLELEEEIKRKKLEEEEAKKKPLKSDKKKKKKKKRKTEL